MISHINKLLIKKKILKKINNHKKYLLADKGYDSNNIREILKQNNYIPIIPYNVRNKNRKKLELKFEFLSILKPPKGVEQKTYLKLKH